MEKWLKRDVEGSQELFNELEALDLEKPKIKEQQKALHPQMRKAFAKYNLGVAHNDGDLMISGRTEGGKLINEKNAIADRHYRKRTAVEVEFQKINQPYIIDCISDLNKLVKQILGQRRFEVKERTTSSDKGLPFYVIQHNWITVGNVVEGLMSTMDKIRDSSLSPLSEIRSLYETALKSVPDDFPLSDSAEGGETMLGRFREAIGGGHVEIVDDNFIRMTLDQGKALADSSRLKESLNGLKKFFKSEENSFRFQQTQGKNRWPIW